MSKLAESYSDMEFYFIHVGPIRSCGGSFGSRDKHCWFPFKEKKEGEKLKMLYNLNFIVMRQEEATKDRR